MMHDSKVSFSRKLVKVNSRICPELAFDAGLEGLEPGEHPCWPHHIALDLGLAYRWLRGLGSIGQRDLSQLEVYVYNMQVSSRFYNNGSCQK